MVKTTARLLLLAALLAACAKREPADEALAQCRARYDKLMRWITGHGQTPATYEELESAGQIKGMDPWGRLYDIEEAGGRFRVWSHGPDGVEGTGDDICYPPLE